MRRWNRDKKHRCPDCHRVWIYAYPETYRPRWWRVYRCPYCKTKFAGWGRGS